MKSITKFSVVPLTDKRHKLDDLFKVLDFQC